MKASRSLSHWIVESAFYLQPIKMVILSTNVQCILDCLPVSVSTEPVYSDDQFANSYLNPYKLIYQCLDIAVLHSLSSQMSTKLRRRRACQNSHPSPTAPSSNQSYLSACGMNATTQKRLNSRNYSTADLSKE